MSSWSRSPDLHAVVPPPVITSGPTNPTTATSATFTFVAVEPGVVQFSCSLDAGGATPCSSPQTYAGPLALGTHTFHVTATDQFGDTSAPSTYTWTIATLFTLTIATNATTFRTGDSVIVSVGVNNPGLAATVDFYFGALLPDGDTVLYFTDFGFASASGSLSNPATLGPIAAGVDLTTPFTFNNAAFVTYRWKGTEPPGSYTLFLAALKAGALADNRIDPGDIVAIATSVITFTP